MGSRHICAKNEFAFFGPVSGKLIVIGAKKSFKKQMVFQFRSQNSSSLTKQYVPSKPKNVIVAFWSLKEMFKTWQHFLRRGKL